MRHGGSSPSSQTLEPPAPLVVDPSDIDLATHFIDTMELAEHISVTIYWVITVIVPYL